MTTQNDDEIPTPPATGPEHEALIDPVHERTQAEVDDEAGTVPVHLRRHEPLGWYVWAEDWLTREGPFATEAEAREVLAARAASRAASREGDR